jgi:hypothetical protein
VTEALVFGVGVWKARNGAKVHVERTDGKEPFVLIGRIAPDPAGLNCKFSWTINGKFINDGDHPDDLIEPWATEIPKTPEDLQETWEVKADDAIKSLTAQLQVADRKTVHLESELASMTVLLRDTVKEREEHKRTAKDRTAELLAADQRVAAIDKELSDAKADRCWFKNLSEEQEQTIKSMKKESEEQQVAREKDDEIERLRKSLVSEMDSNIKETGRLKKLIAGLEEENVSQGYKLSAAIDERATKQKQDDPFLSAISRMKVLLVVCRAITVLLLVAIPLAGQWIPQGPGALFAEFILWIGVCFIGATIAGEIQHGIRSNEAEYQRIRDKVAPERRQDL